jgi:hypothetical protein
MKRVAAGFAAILIASSAFAQQPAQKIAPVGTPAAGALSNQRAPLPLTGKKQLEIYGKALATPKPLATGELGAPARITPRNLYVDGSTYAWVKRGTVAPSEGPTGVAHTFGNPNQSQSILELHFRAAAGKQYILDCAIRGPGVHSIKVGFGGPAIATVEGHLVSAIAATAQARDVVLQLVSDKGFEWTSCDIVPVNR